MEPTTTDASTSRRCLLSSAAAAGALALSGCTSTLPPLGQRVRFGRVDVPPADPPEYRQWVPAASTLPDDATETVHAGRPPDLPPSSLGRGLFVATADWLGTAFESYDLAVGLGRTLVLEGETDRRTVADALAGTGYAAAGSYKGYDLYTRDDVPRTVAAGEGAAVMATGSSGRDRIAAVVDAREGRRERRHETDATFAAITDAAGGNDFDIIDGLRVVRDAVAEAVTSSTSHVYTDAAAIVRDQYLFESADAVPEERIRRELRASRAAVRADAVDVWTDGRRAVVDLRTDSPANPEFRTPLITWGAAYDLDEQAVTLRHEAGESVAADALAIDVQTPDDDSGVLDAPEGRQFADAQNTVAPSDSLTVPVDPDAGTVHVRYRPVEDRSITLFSYRIP
jgi:hypothetical protein